MRQSGVVELEKKTCPCGCGLTYRGLPGKPADYFSRAHDPRASGSPAEAPRRAGRPRKNKAAYAPEHGEGGSAELVLEDGVGETIDLRELAL